RVRQAEVPRRAERLARHQRDLRLLQDQRGQLHRRLGTLAAELLAQQLLDRRVGVERALRLGHTTPGISFSIRTIVLRRRSNDSRISATADRSPVTAASAAACDTFATLDVACDWRLAAAFTTSAGPISQPTRQPVIAYV